MSLRGKRFRIKAKRFVLACGGLENARLLWSHVVFKGTALEISTMWLVDILWITRGRCLVRLNCLDHINFHPVGMSLSWGHGTGRHSSSLRRRKSARRYSIII